LALFPRIVEATGGRCSHVLVVDHDETSRVPELEKLLVEGLQRPAGAEREQWIEEACRGVAELARELRELIAAHEAAGDFLSEPLVDTRPPDPPRP